MHRATNEASMNVCLFDKSGTQKTLHMELLVRVQYSVASLSPSCNTVGNIMDH